MDEEKYLAEVKASWKKEAMMMGGGPQGMPQEGDIDAMEIERAFMDQAYNYIQSKAGPLLQPEYRLGFEVVYKNDKNTRMVGIFAFRVDNELLFIPVFFVSSNIKGTDLLYRSKTKLFVPLTEEWCDSIIGNIKFKQGELIDEQNPHRMDGLNLDKIIEPPQTRKFAKQAYADMLEKLLFEDETEESVKLASFLKEAGVNGLEFVKDLMDKDAEMAEAAFVNYGDMSWIPDSVNKTTPDSILSFKLASTKCASSELEDFYQKGYVVHDKRAAANKSVKALHNFKEGADLGPVEIMDQDMNALRVLLFGSMWDKKRNEKSTEKELPAYTSVGGSSYDGEMSTCGGSVNAYDLATKKLLNIDGDFEDIIVPEGEPVVMDEAKQVSPANMSVGNAYLVVTKDGRYAEPYYVVAKSKKGNVYNFDTVQHPEDLDTDYKPYLSTLTISDIKDAASVWGKDVYATRDIVILPIKLGEGKRMKSDSIVPFGSKQLHAFMKYGSETESPARIVCRDTDDFTLKTAGRLINGTNEFGALVGLMKECNLDEKTASEIIDTVKEKRVLNFLYEKSATSLQFADIPDMDGTAYDSIYNVLSEETPQIEVIEADGQYPEIPTVDEILADEKRLTDAGPLGNMHPMELAEVSQRTGVKSIFDHGVIASLSKTFDSKGLIDNYLPDLEVALDKLGRLLFLFYWKPEDFMELYGTDDQSSLENSLVSNFKSFGELVLELKNKNQQYSLGSAPLPS